MIITWSCFGNKTQKCRKLWNYYQTKTSKHWHKFKKIKTAQGLFTFPHWVSCDWVIIPNGGTLTSKCKLQHLLGPQLISRSLPRSFHNIRLKLSNPYDGNSPSRMTAVTLSFGSLLGWDVHMYQQLPLAGYISKMQSLLVHTFQLSQTSVLFPVGRK